MSHHLPDDLARWPTDANELLGVDANADDLAVRRAYTKLIKAFKPEQHPEQFRRIRAAYEEVLHRRKFFEQLRLQFPGMVIGPTPESDPPAETLPMPTPVAPAPDHPDTYWEWAVAGELERAHATLQEAVVRNATNDVRLRLYWLETVHAGLSQQQSAVRWLVEDMLEHGLQTPASEAYRQELLVNGADAARAGSRLFDAPAAPSRVAEITSWRWHAALSQRHWDVVRDEWSTARERIRRNDEEAWLGLVLSAVDVLAWSAGDTKVNELLAKCKVEVDELQYHGVRMDGAFDRLELLAELTTHWPMVKNQPGLPPALIDFMPRAWHTAFAQIEGDQRQLLAAINANPASWLRHFDTVERYSPHLLNQFIEQLEQKQYRVPEDQPGPDESSVAGLVTEFFKGRVKQEYDTLRPALLKFCLREHLRPEWLLRFVPEVPTRGDEQNRPIPYVIICDRPLRTVCWAVHLFWA